MIWKCIQWGTQAWELAVGLRAMSMVMTFHPSRSPGGRLQWSDSSGSSGPAWAQSRSTKFRVRTTQFRWTPEFTQLRVNVVQWLDPIGLNESCLWITLGWPSPAFGPIIVYHILCTVWSGQHDQVLLLDKSKVNKVLPCICHHTLWPPFWSLGGWPLTASGDVGYSELRCCGR